MGIGGKSQAVLANKLAEAARDCRAKWHLAYSILPDLTLGHTQGSMSANRAPRLGGVGNPLFFSKMDRLQVSDTRG